jgi:2-dehydro-3-deoxygluconokinase
MSTNDTSWDRKRTILALGEPLIELRFDGNNALGVSIGGDVANILACLSRIMEPRVNELQLLTSLGGSFYSKWLRDNLRRHGIEVIGPPGLGEPGVYGISPDPSIQPTSSYWRAESAARKFFATLSLAELKKIAPEADVVIITGITLALCSDASFEELLHWVGQLPLRATVALDCNFRPALWPDVETARRRLDRFQRAVALLVTSLEDEKLLRPRCALSEVLDRLGHVSAEVVLRAGSTGCWVCVDGRWREARTTPQEVVDATGAGDSHLAGYIAARIHGHPPLLAAHFANAVAGVIIAQRGSIPHDRSLLPTLPAAVVS